MECVLITKVRYFFALACIISLYPLMTRAKTNSVDLTINCPHISIHGKENVVNYITFLAGRGSERMNKDRPTYPLFQNPTTVGIKIPSNMVKTGYFNDGITYRPSNGMVVCKYSSSMGFPGFYLSSPMKNTKNGCVMSAGAQQIHLRIPIGSFRHEPDLSRK